MMKSYLPWLFASMIALVLAGCDSTTKPSQAPVDTKSDISVTPDEPKATSGQNGEIALSPNDVYAGSIKTAAANVDVATSVTAGGLKFWMTRSDPREGDFAAVSFNVDDLVVGEGYELTINMTSTYLKEKNVDFMVYEVLMDDTLLLTEDVAMSKQPNEIKIRFLAEKPEISFTIRSVALQDCPPFDWGKYGSPLVIEKVALDMVLDAPTLSVKATSPFSIIN